jgi:hypothetical protein
MRLLLLDLRPILADRYCIVINHLSVLEEGGRPPVLIYTNFTHTPGRAAFDVWIWFCEVFNI